MKKIIPVLIAVFMIIVIAVIGVGARLMEKYSYSKERADLTEYFEVRGEGDVPVILQDERIEEHARLIDGVCYFDLATVHKYFNDRFFLDTKEGLLLYTLPDAIVSTLIGEQTVSVGTDGSTRDYIIARYEGDVLYVAADFVKEYSNFSYTLYTDPYRMQVYTEWNPRQTATILKDTQVRYQGGVKSDILTDVAKGTEVTVLEEMENWSKVKAEGAFIGYVENKRLSEQTTVEPVPVTDYVEPVYTSNTRDHKINLAWHVVASVAGNDTLVPMLAEAKSVNVVSPTWFALSDNAGNFTSFASQNYVDTAHDMGLEVWALVDNFTNPDVDTYEVLAGLSTRQHLIDGLIGAALQYRLDGINIDFENISLDAGEPFVEFIRELSIPCRQNGIVLSVDNYVPMGYTDHYDREEQGIVADYVIVMGYDEHYAGGEPGSVASLPYVQGGITRTLEQVPKEKIITGVPFYTRVWTETDEGVKSSAIGIAEARQWVEDNNVELYWQQELGQFYGELSIEDGVKYLWMEEEDSLALKMKAIKEEDLAGVACWKLGLEDAVVWDSITWD